MNTKEEDEEQKRRFESNLEEAEQGDVDAQWSVGYAYGLGEVVEQDYEQAFEWYMKAAEQGDATAQNNVGYAYRYGQGVEQDYEQAFKWYMKSAEQWNAFAQWSVGYAYRYGQGVEQDNEKAFKWTMKAAEQGDADAIGAMKSMQDLLQKSSTVNETEKFLKEDTKEDENIITDQIGFTNKLDEGISAYNHGDYQTAYDLWNSLASSGLPDAQYHLAILYYRGHGVARNYAKAKKLCEQAKQQEYPKACILLASIYLQGKVTELSTKEVSDKVHKLYKETATKGDAEAQFLLAKQYEAGNGAKKDFAKAIYWHTRAANQGFRKAVLLLRTMELEKKRSEGKISNPELLRLAEEYENQSNLKSAELIAETLLKENPSNEAVRLLLERIKKKLISD